MNRKRLAYLANFLIVKPNFVLLAIIAGLSIYSYRHFSSLPGDSARVQIMISVITLAVLLLVATFSLLTSLVPYLSLMIRKRMLETDEDERQDIIKVALQEVQHAPGWVTVGLRIDGLRKPLLGYVRARLVFEDGTLSEPLLFTDVRREGRRRVGILAEKALWLPHVRDYRIQATILHFEDVFHLLALPYREREHLGFFTEPLRRAEEMPDLATEASDDPVLKVMHHKMAKGELLDYKKYAPGDDVRRIIWKNYARSRELTVRIPDRHFPYVSHINLMASFYDGSGAELEGALKAILLTIYKEKLRQVVDAILDQGFSVNFLPDRALTHHYELDEYNRIIYAISAGEWQRERTPRQFLRESTPRLRGGSNLLVVASLCPAEELRDLRNGALADLNLGVYRAERTLALSQPPSLLKRLFLVHPFDALESAKRQSGARETMRYLDRNAAQLDSAADHTSTRLIAL